MRQFGVEIEVAGIRMERAARALNLVGIEATVEGYNHTRRNHWKIVSDASVRDGFEIVSPPLSGESGLEAVRVAITALDDAGAKINRTCGLHIHFDAADFTGDDIKTIIGRYAEFEEDIDAFMPPSRRADNNRYCQSVKHLVENRAYNETNTIGALARIQDSRYMKLNLQSYHRHGTIEFRQHSGTVNAAKVLNWIRFLDAFISESCRQARQPQGAARQINASGRLARVYELIDSGACLEEIMEALNWKRHSVRAAVTRLRQAGATITCQRQAGRTCYRIEGQQASRPADSVMNGIPTDVATFYRNRAAILAM